MPEEVILPTGFLVVEPTCRNSLNAYDQDTNTSSRQLENTELGTAEQVFGPFTITTDLAERGTLEIDFKIQWATADTNDAILLFVGPAQNGPWTEFRRTYAQQLYTPVAGGPLVWIPNDVSSIVGDWDVFYVLSQFFNGDGFSDPPIPGGR